MSNYAGAKECFSDSAQVQKYIDLDSSNLSLEMLRDSLDRSFKIILLHGKPGVGKSMLR